MLELCGGDLRVELGHIGMHEVRSRILLVIDGGNFVLAMPSRHFSIECRFSKLR